MDTQMDGMSGAVCVQTNEPENRVIAFRRAADGALIRLGAYATGRAGDEKPHLTSQGSVTLSGDGRRLLVTNAASDDVSVFAVRDEALHAVIVEAYVKGVFTRKVDDLVRALGIDGISRSEVSRICKVLDEEVKAFLSRPIEDEHPYVWLRVEGDGCSSSEMRGTALPGIQRPRADLGQLLHVVRLEEAQVDDLNFWRSVTKRNEVQLHQSAQEAIRSA